ncbi:MAG: hypothetical protein ACRDOJ_04525 [Nocardioidaceae bacterium]
MTLALEGPQVCDRCGHPVCASCQPDAISRCADDATVHCVFCAADCGVCLDEALTEQRAAQAADAARFGPR